jgi:hypothetical protein
VLYRHWTLMDSLIHTPELMACIRTFKEGGPGRQVLMYVLAQTGIPIHQVRALAADLTHCVRWQCARGISVAIADARFTSSPHKAMVRPDCRLGMRAKEW